MLNAEPIIDALILAAGSSTRLGYPKQLVTINDETLIIAIARRMLAAVNGSVYIVVGAFKDAISDALQGHSVKIVYNANWADGMGASIRRGMQTIEEDNRAPSGVLLALVDQPMIPIAHYIELITQHTMHREACIASYYNDTMGVPALFPKGLFCQLRNLESGAGAKSLLKDNPVIRVNCPMASIDIDTPSDLAALT